MSTTLSSIVDGIETKAESYIYEKDSDSDLVLSARHAKLLIANAILGQRANRPYPTSAHYETYASVLVELGDLFDKALSLARDSRQNEKAEKQRVQQALGSHTGPKIARIKKYNPVNDTSPAIDPRAIKGALAKEIVGIIGLVDNHYMAAGMIVAISVLFDAIESGAFNITTSTESS